MAEVPAELLALLAQPMGADTAAASPPLSGPPVAQFPNSPIPGAQMPMGDPAMSGPAGVPQGPAPAPPPQPSYVRVDRDPANPTSAHQEFAKEYVAASIKRSVEFIERKIQDYELYEDLYWNKRLLNQWKWSKDRALSYNRAQRDKPVDPTDWNSNLTIAVQPVVDAIAQALFKVVFRTEEYLQVKASPRNQTGSIEDPQFPTAKKLQQVLLNQCRDMRFASRTYEFLQDWLVFGTGVAKTPWYSRAVKETYADETTGQVFSQPRVTRQGTAFDLVNLARFLPDPDALSSDIDRWGFIGDRAEMDYHKLVGLFKTKKRNGPFNLNYSEFLDRWPDRGDAPGQAPEIPIKQDEDARTGLSSGGATGLQVWNWHGLIPYPDGAKECVCIFITGLAAKEAAEGVMVCLHERAALSTGGRPYILAHFIPRSGPLGIGIIESNLDIIWSLSSLVNMFIDTVKLISCPTPLVHERSPLAIEFKASAGGNVWYPGKILTYRNTPDEITNFNLAVSDLGAILNGIQYLEKQWEKRTTVSDSTRAISEQRKTATETAALQEQAAQPIEVLLKLLDESVLVPFGKIALAQMQAHLYEDQAIWIKGPNGVPQPVTLTVEELQTGEYEVHSAIQAQDPAKVSRAQIMTQLLPAMEQVAMPMLLLENKHYVRSGMIQQILDNLGATEGATILADVDDATKQQILMTLMPPPQPGGPNGAESGGEPGTNGGQPTPSGPPQQQELFPPPGSLQPGTNGGPAGSEPSNLNEILQLLQFQGMQQSPVQPGQQTPAG